MKYFFLAEGWTYHRIWEMGGIWNENLWQRKPVIQRLNLGIIENQEILWLYQVEDAVLMLEVKPTPNLTNPVSTIGQVIVKRLIDAEATIELLNRSETILNTFSHSEITPSV
jgi:hypothetical protein